MERDRVSEVMNGEGGNYLPLRFGMHGEDGAASPWELNPVERAGMKAVVLESWTHERFCEDGW